MMKRIETIADMVKQGVIAADIGTDHAFLPVLLIRSGRCEKVYACDIAEGPLEAARKNIAKNGMQEQIIPVLSDGFDRVPADADAAVLAGMGYYTAADILTRAAERLDGMKQIIVEVNRNVREMRTWISDRNYTVIDERTVYERGFDYVIISFNTRRHDSYNEKELLCGPILMRRRDEEYLAFVQRKITSLQKRLAKIPDTSSPAYAEGEKELAMYWSVLHE